MTALPQAVPLSRKWVEMREIAGEAVWDVPGRGDAKWRSPVCLASSPPGAKRRLGRGAAKMAAAVQYIYNR